MTICYQNPFIVCVGSKTTQFGVSLNEPYYLAFQKKVFSSLTTRQFIKSKVLNHFQIMVCLLFFADSWHFTITDTITTIANSHYLLSFSFKLND